MGGWVLGRRVSDGGECADPPAGPCPSARLSDLHPCAPTGVEVTAGSIAMSVQYGGFPIWAQTDDLCAKMACPAPAGAVTVTFQQLFPIITPPGNYVVTLRGADAAQQPLFCVAVDFAVTPGLRGAAGGVRQALQRWGNRSLRLGQPT